MLPTSWATGRRSRLSAWRGTASSTRQGPLEKARERLLRRHVSATYLQPVGDPAAELVEAARELEADLVVLGRRSRSLRRVVLGSVSDAVVRRAPCDVLVVR